MGHPYPNALEANRGVLIEACLILDTADVDYVVAGGWSPLLLGNHPSLRHPGTRDVDLLFNDGQEPIKNAVRALLDAGYVPSAKHPFQLLKKLTVDHQDLVFNIDLMHPAEKEQKGELFADILDLGIKDDYDALETKAMKSISLPSARIVFDERLISTVNVTGFLPNGASRSVTIPLVDEVALVLAKCASVDNPKRQRDSFDIYYLLSGANGQGIASRLKALAARFPQVEEQVDKLRDFLTKKPGMFARYAEKSGGQDLPQDVESLVLQRLF